MDCGGANNQAVMYALDSVSSNSMKSANPHSGFHAETVAKTLQAGGVDPTCNQGGNVIVEPVYALQGNGIDRAETAGCNGDGVHVPTLTGDHENRVTDYTAVCVSEHPPVYGVDCRNAALDEEKTHTLQAGQTPYVLTSGKPPRKYSIRRLTPLECCRLQGFPDGWGVPDHKDRLSDEELAFWQQVRDTSASIAGKQPKKYSAEALTKWYNGLHTDSAEYKMWGNGIALPCAAFVLGGVAETLMEESKNEKV